MTVSRMNRPPGIIRDAPAPAALRRMRLIATGLLVAMAALFLIAHALTPLHPAFGFVRAFAEAAMVGGLADWFAVTALFRHPLGLPIPHTAIVPRNKDRIGDTLALFLRDNFLVPQVVARRMARLDVAAAAGRFLAAPPEQGRLWRGASRLLAGLLEGLDPERFGTMVKGALAQRLRDFNAAPLMGQALASAIADDRHVPLLDQLIRWIARLVAENEALIRNMVHERSGSILRWTGLDETIADKIIDAIDKLLGDMADDPGHPLRAKLEDALRDLAHDLQYDPAMAARVQQLKGALLDNPAVERWWVGMWERMRGGLIKRLRAPGDGFGTQVTELLHQLGDTLTREERLRRTINRFTRRAAVGLAADYGDGIVRLVSDTVRGWDAATITDRLENAVGRDLQYIRINGTLVGGLVGLAIHIVEMAL